MVIGDRLKALREQRNMSQGRHREAHRYAYSVVISRVWKTGTRFRPSETREKLARAMEVPMYQLFYDGERPPAPPTPMPKVRQRLGQFGS